MLMIYRSSARLARIPVTAQHQSSASTSVDTNLDFKPLDIGYRREQIRVQRERYVRAVPPPRRERQPTDQHWPDVWPVARGFHPAAVPLPLRQGYVDKPEVRAPPGPDANAELMKVTNFLHLTPLAIEKQCAAIRQFCTAWPANLTDERLERIRPMEVITQDFVHATPTIRHPDARIVKLRLPLSSLQLDDHARDKFLRLIGPQRYDIDTDLVTITTDRCPYRRQNADYALYLLTVLYFESCKVEEWEESKSDADMEKFEFEGSLSQRAVENLGIKDSKVIEKYAKSVTNLLNIGEDERLIDAYREAVLELLDLPKDVA